MLGEFRLSPQRCAPQQPLRGSGVIDSTVGFQLTGPVQLRGTALQRGFCRQMESPFYLNGGFMHPNEVKLNGNVEQMMEEAQKLSDRHVSALKEQIDRQSEKTK